MTSLPQPDEFQTRLADAANPSRPRRHWLKLLAYILGGAVLAAALAAAGYAYLQPAPLEAVQPKIGPAVTAVYASGTVEASVMLPVSPRVGGKLIALMSDEHANVRKGQVLARLESDDLAGNIAQLKASAAFAQADMERDTRLMDANAIARQTYERAVADAKMAQGQLQQAEAQAGFMTLSAPDDCAVIERDGEIGQFIAANTPLFWLSCHSVQRISAQVDEEDIPMVRAGQKVLIRADAFPGKIFEANVTEVTPKGDPVGRSYRVRINLPVSNPLQIGMTTEANIITAARQNAMLLPASAVSGGKVWKIVGGKAVAAAVSLGAKGSCWVEILTGISRQDTVLRNAATPPPSGDLRITLIKQ